MCNSPLKIPNDETKTYKIAQCRKCDECFKARKRHWVGRMLAEEQTADHVWFTTFTYGGGYGNKEAYWLDYNHLQLMFKRLRKDGYKFKYVAVGEHGTQRDRAHWHVMFYFQGDTPPVEQMGKRITWPYWIKGTSQIEKPRSSHGAAVYIMDYLSKDNLAKGLMKYSKRPMLGQEYLLEYAREHARKGVALFSQSDRFTIPDVKNNKGQLFYYPVGRTTAIYDKMLAAYLETWALCRPDQKLRQSNDFHEWFEELQQDPHKLPPASWEFCSRHYDLQQFLTMKVKRIHPLTHRLAIEYLSEPGVYATASVIEADKWGNATWRANLDLDVQDVSAQLLQDVLLPKTLLALVLAINEGPKHLKLHLPGLPYQLENYNSQFGGTKVPSNELPSSKNKSVPLRLATDLTDRAS